MDFNSLVVRLALLLSIPGCGRPPAHYPGFEVYVDTFLREGASRGKTVDLWGVNIALVDTISAPMSPLTVGVCDPSENKIEILRSFWETYPQYHEQLVFHELGHCLLAKPHIACPSIMCEYLISNTIYDDNRSQLLDVLFAN